MELEKHQSKFKSYEEDTTTYLDTLMANGLVESGFHKKLGLSPHQIAMQPVFDAYADRKLWGLVAKDYVIYSHEADSENDHRISQGLVELGDFTNLRQLWRSYLVEVRIWYRNRRHEFGVDSTEQTSADAKKWAEAKRRAIAAFEVYRSYVSALSAVRELTWIDEEIELLEQETIRKPRMRKPRPEKMDAELFWSLIANAISKSDGSIDIFNGHIVNQLQDYKATEIKRFQNTLLDKMEAINHWDLWALAYISQGGCSDDSFLYFCAWIISQGEDTYKLALTDVHDLMPLVPSDKLVWNEGLLYAANEAYEIRSSGKEMSIKERKETPPKGEEWQEDKVAMTYPEIAKHYQ